MAQGNWYVLSDNGAGAVSGSDPSFGAGTVSYITGAAQVTLGALPDVGSQIMLAWATPAHTSIRVGNAAIDTKIIVNHSLGEAFAGHDDDYRAGWWDRKNVHGRDRRHDQRQLLYGLCERGHRRSALRICRAPGRGQQNRPGLSAGHQIQHTFTGVSAPGGIAVVDLGEAVEPGSITLQWSTQSTVKFDSLVALVEWVPDGNGGWKQQQGTILTSASERIRRYNHVATDNGAGGIIGSGSALNYGTGELTLPLLPSLSQNIWSNAQRKLGRVLRQRDA